MFGMQRKARIIALQVLYEVDSTNHTIEEVITRLLKEAELPNENAKYTGNLVKGVMQNIGYIDKNIQCFAPAWPIKQMSKIDRNILRLAIFEILIDNKVPVRAAINEAVEIAKLFGSGNSSRLVNGVLGSVSATLDEKTLERGRKWQPFMTV